MARTITIGEILDQVTATKSRKKKAEILRANPSNPFFLFLSMAMDPEIEWSFGDIPKDEMPPYKEDDIPDGLGQTTLMSEARRLYIFTSESPISLRRKGEIYTAIAEALDTNERKYFTEVVRGEFKVSGLTLRLVNEVYGAAPPIRRLVSRQNALASR